MSKTYTEEQVKTIVGNVVQHITDNIYQFRKVDFESAKTRALDAITSPEKHQEVNKQNSLRYFQSYNRLKEVLETIRDNQYHLQVGKFTERQKLEK